MLKVCCLDEDFTLTTYQSFSPELVDGMKTEYKGAFRVNSTEYYLAITKNGSVTLNKYIRNNLTTE